jgi:hypothetical protein
MAARGLTGLVRLRDEAVWCRLALESFVGWCDALAIVLNRCRDATPAIVAAFAAEHGDKVRVYDYPHEIWPMGPGHDRISSDDPRSSAAFYNFTQDRAATTHAVKLDGDMVMMDGAGAEIRRLFEAGHDRIRFSGTDIVGDALTQIGCQPLCRTNGVYRITPRTRYRQGPMTQNLQGIAGLPEHEIERPAFLHFKWARKPFAAATAQWPANWRELDHFRRIAMRRWPVGPYEGEYPASVLALVGKR